MLSVTGDGAAPEPLSPKQSPANYNARLQSPSNISVADHVILLMVGCRLQATLIRKLRSAHSATKSRTFQIKKTKINIAHLRARSLSAGMPDSPRSPSPLPGLS